MEVIELNFNWTSQEWGLSELRDNDGINEFCILTPCPLLVLVTVGTERTVSVSGGSIGIQFKHSSVE